MRKNVTERRIFIGEDELKKKSGSLGWFENRKLKKRLNAFDKHEIKSYVTQILVKTDNIRCDEGTLAALAEEMIAATSDNLDRDMKAIYGDVLGEWVILAAKDIDRSLPMKQATQDYYKLKEGDPLLNWYKKSNKDAPRTVDRIRSFTAYVSSLVKFSLLIEPGYLRPHLSAFADQFNELSCFFDSVELSPEEMSQRAFDANRLCKARNQKLECVDSSRVVLHLPSALTSNEPGNSLNHNYRQPADIFGDLDIPKYNPSDSYGTGDFIHANYIAGGPLLNKFICTQAPMKKTVGDFWRMVWQEKPEYIFMLCDATDSESLGSMGTEETDSCLAYWPKIKEQELQFGKLIVKNVAINGTMDPLFTVTDLTIHHIDKPSFIIHVQHWQWDWNDYRDFRWPLRLLQRSRVSSRPTIVHCLDGCSRTGTLVYIEVLLMQLLRGTADYEHPLLTCAIFVRLQRRHAIESYIQFLFACRVVLHYVQPYVMSKYQRFSLGYMFKDSGFIGKFEDLAVEWSRKNLMQ